MRRRAVSSKRSAMFPTSSQRLLGCSSRRGGRFLQSQVRDSLDAAGPQTAGPAQEQQRRSGRRTLPQHLWRSSSQAEGASDCSDSSNSAVTRVPASTPPRVGRAAVSAFAGDRLRAGVSKREGLCCIAPDGCVSPNRTAWLVCAQGRSPWRHRAGWLVLAQDNAALGVGLTIALMGHLRTSGELGGAPVGKLAGALS